MTKEEATSEWQGHSWFVYVTAVRETSALGHKPSFIPAIKALRGGRDGLDLAEAKELVDGMRTGTPCVFGFADEAAAKDAKAELERAGMTVSVSRDSPFFPSTGTQVS